MWLCVTDASSCASRWNRATRFGIVSDGRRQDLQRDVAVQLRVVRPIHLAHPAAAEWRDDFVRADARARGKKHEALGPVNE